MITLISIALGGAFGAMLRYGVGGWVNALFGGTIYGGTLAVNLMGCFLMGLLWGLFEQSILHPSFRGLTVIGILGAFTTFSSFGLENFILIRHQHWRALVANILVNNMGGIFLVFIGYLLSRQIGTFFGR